MVKTHHGRKAHIPAAMSTTSTVPAAASASGRPGTAAAGSQKANDSKPKEVITFPYEVEPVEEDLDYLKAFSTAYDCDEDSKTKCKYKVEK